jgi:hypothetical protein
MKSDDFRVVTLHIEGVNIDNLSLDDIGQYLADFAQLLGPDVNPRFHSIKRGSMTMGARVQREREIDVKTRAFLLRTGDAPEDAVRARERISRRLGIHRAKRATLLDSTNTKVIEIPIERPAPAPAVLPAISRAGSLQGKIIRIGGKQDIVSVEIQDVDGHVYLCKATRDVARKLAREMFDPSVRVHGHGRWARTADGVWRVDDFQVSTFDVLDDTSFSDVIRELRSIPSAWKDLDDPSAAMDQIRKREL